MTRIPSDALKPPGDRSIAVQEITLLVGLFAAIVPFIKNFSFFVAQSIVSGNFRQALVARIGDGVAVTGRR
jgi:hypothetical protein